MQILLILQADNSFYRASGTGEPVKVQYDHVPKTHSKSEDNMFKQFLMIGMLLLTGFGFTIAQETDKPKTNTQVPRFGIGPQLGWQKSSSADNGTLMPGAALRIRISEAFGLEGSINYRSEDYADGALTVKTWPIMITGMIYPVRYFYGAIGIGWYNTSFDYGNQTFTQTLKDNTQQNFGWHLGGGLEVPATKVINITADIRYVFLNYDFGELEKAANSGDLISNFFMITVGASFKLHL